MAMVAMGGMGDVPLAELHKRRTANAFMTDIKMIAADILVRSGGADDLLLETSHEQHAFEKRQPLGAGQGRGHGFLRIFLILAFLKPNDWASARKDEKDACKKPLAGLRPRAMLDKK